MAALNAAPGRILIVDDEANIRAGLCDLLTQAGHTVGEAASGAEALSLLESFACDVAVVDLQMPGMSGVELMESVRARWPQIAVVILTGHGTLQTAIAAVKQGASDYLLKPAAPAEIRAALARALAAARRQQEQRQLFTTLKGSLSRLERLASPSGRGSAADPRGPYGDRLQIGDLDIELRAHTVRRAGSPVSLSRSEFKLLVALALQAGEVVDYVTLVQHALGYQSEAYEAKELIKRHVFGLRQKLEPDPSAPRYILNVRGVGYRLAQHPK